jgi:hypothetical protein
LIFAPHRLRDARALIVSSDDSRILPTAAADDDDDDAAFSTEPREIRHLQ